MARALRNEQPGGITSLLEATNPKDRVRDDGGRFQDQLSK